MSFKVLRQSSRSAARCGRLKTNHGIILTPFFMPVATRGAVRHLSCQELASLGTQIVLANTYHLMLRPGADLIKKLGGLHKFMDWPGPILTDSGGFQVFSLAGTKNRRHSLVKITAQGVHFRSCWDGRPLYLTPQKSLKIQLDLGVDIAVCLDECVALPAPKDKLESAVALTTKWAKRTKNYLEKRELSRPPLLFGVIQGGLDKELRLRSLSELLAIGFDGYNIGGLSVGETAEEMYGVLDFLVSQMPANKPRYLMGVGYPDNIVEAVKRGVDMFDCVIPSREGRHGRIFKWRHRDLNKKDFFTSYNITNAKFRRLDSPINPESNLRVLRNLSFAYLHHLFKIGEPLGQRLATLNNLEFYLELMRHIRQAIRQDKL